MKVNSLYISLEHENQLKKLFPGCSTTEAVDSAVNVAYERISEIANEVHLFRLPALAVIRNIMNLEIREVRRTRQFEGPVTIRLFHDRICDTIFHITHTSTILIRTTEDDLGTARLDCMYVIQPPAQLIRRLKSEDIRLLFKVRLDDKRRLSGKTFWA